MIINEKTGLIKKESLKVSRSSLFLYGSAQPNYLWSQTFNSIQINIPLCNSIRSSQINIVVTANSIKVSTKGTGKQQSLISPILVILKETFLHRVNEPSDIYDIDWSIISTDDEHSNRFLQINLLKNANVSSSDEPLNPALQGLDGLILCWWDRLFKSEKPMNHEAFALLISPKFQSQNTDFGDHQHTKFNEESATTENLNAARKLFMQKVQKYSACDGPFPIGLQMNEIESNNMI